MVERSEGKLHPLIEFLIIAGIILVCSLCSSFFMSKIITQKSYAETEGIINIFSWLNMIFPFVASFVCIKLIEHRNINIFKLFTIVLCIMLFCNYIHLITLNYIGARFGVVYLAKLTSANSFVKPFVTAFLITLFIYIFDLPKADAYVFDKKMLCGLFKHVMLLLFSLGIWRLIWIYRVTKYLNCTENEENRNPLTKLLLCMFVPFYSIYWTYKSAIMVDRLSKTVNLSSDLAVPCLVLEIFVPIIPPVLIQDKINKIVTSDLNID